MPIDNFAATPVDTQRNDDVDAAMGFEANVGDDNATAFTKGLQSSLFRNSDEGRKLTVEFAKQKLANQLALQLQERKEQLAQKYRPYEQFMKMPNGAVWGFGQQGSKELKAADPEESNLYLAKTRAEIAKADSESDPEVIAANKAKAIAAPKLIDAQADYYTGAKSAMANSAAALGAARVDSIAHPKAKPRTLSPADEAIIEKAAEAEVVGRTANDPMLPFAWTSAVKKDPSIVQRKQAAIARRREEFQNSAAPNEDSNAPPDFGNLLAPLHVGD